MVTVAGVRPILVWLVVFALACVACAQGSKTSPPAPTATFARPTPTPAFPTLGVTPEASLAIEAFCPSAGQPASGAELAIVDPNVSMQLPPRWTSVDVDTYRDAFQAVVDAVNDPRLTKMAEWQFGQIDSNVIRRVARGLSGPSRALVALPVSVLPERADLKAMVDARLDDETANGLPSKRIGVVPTELPIGPAYCVAWIGGADLGIPGQTIEYIAGLPDGRGISIGTTAPVGDAIFPDLIRSIALSMASD